jgi:hypothetical protein
VSIFRRNRSRAETDPAVADDVDVPTDVGEDPDPTAEETEAAEQPLSRDAGPFDVAEVEGREDRVDLGALWIRPVPGMELRLEVDQQSQQVNAATAVIGESALQVQAFAAPRSSGLWAQIRREIAEAVERQGGTVEEYSSTLGTALRTRMPSEAGGRTVFAPATFVGVDGPRWFLRGVLSGRAAIDDAAAEPLLEVIRGLVVVRGVEPMAPRELLALRLPTDARAEPDEEAEQQRPDIDPFERGPEITEVR